jgi:simple sugar transport system ATP-binding protein
MANLVEMRGIQKSFGPVRALSSVDLSLGYNEVLGLVGDNAAGKSTLMKILTGAYHPDAGEIYFEGREVEFKSPSDSRDMGIEMVYQDFALAGNLNVSANIYMGRESVKGYLGGLVSLLDERGMRDGARDLLSRLRINIRSVRLLVENLSGGQRQSVAIGRSTAFDAKVVIMDEPTASLAVKEVGKVLELIRNLKGHNVAVILISHRLEDVMHVSDRIMVLRHGEKVGDVLTAKTSMDEVVSLIVGGEKVDERE